MSRLFLAAPFTQIINPSTGLVDGVWRHRIDGLRNLFLDAGFSVFSAHVLEDWGAALVDPLVYTPRDYQEMLLADQVCVIVGSPPSVGVCVELGWGNGLKKANTIVA